MNNQEKAKRLVSGYNNSIQRHTGMDWIPEDVYVVWSSKTLQHWKMMLSSDRTDEYFEVTHNGDKGETYLDIYEKIGNVCIKDKETS